jgi:N-acetylneuraminic acid mutarotase
MAQVPTARTNHMVASVNNKIYVIGGYHPSVGTFNTVEEYNPATNTWATKASMPTKRSDAGIAVVNGKIYVMGGTSNFSTSVAVNEVYDPATNTWTTKAPMLSARMFLAGAVVNNKIYAIGGVKTSAAVNTNEEYDPATNVWTAKAVMPTARMYLAVQAANSKVYAMGGLTGTSTAMSNNEEYSPSTNTWATKAALPTASYAMGSGIFNGNIYLIGGVQSGSPSKTVLQYDVLNNLYYAKLNYPISISWPVSASVNGFIYSMGGDDNIATVYQNHYRYDPGLPVPVATAYDEATSTSPLASGFTSGWIDFDLKALVQEWVDGVRVNNGLVIYTGVSDQFSINSRENSANKPQLIVTY